LYGSRIGQFGVPDRIELINPRPVSNTEYPVHLGKDVGISPTDEIIVDNVYRLPTSGRIRIDDETIYYDRAVSDGGLSAGISYLEGVTRGYQGTTVTPHRLGAVVEALDDKMEWEFDDTYWVYGQGASEVWVRYSDASVWQRGGQVPASLPRVSNVSIVTNGDTATISWDTDIPTSSWVMYDTYGNAEKYNGNRPAGWWPVYMNGTNRDQADIPLETHHVRTLTGLTPGALYHYALYNRGPGSTTTPDATFTAGGCPAEPCLQPAPSPTG
jgi:hypothetical protein